MQRLLDSKPGAAHAFLRSVLSVKGLGLPCVMDSPHPGGNPIYGQDVVGWASQDLSERGSDRARRLDRPRSVHNRIQRRWDVTIHHTHPQWHHAAMATPCGHNNPTVALRW